MSSYLDSPGLNVSPAGNVMPSTFVTIDATQGDFLCRQATAAADPIIGVSQVGPDQPPGAGAIFGSTTTPPAGKPGEQIQLYAIGDTAPITLGAGGCNPGDLLTADASGNGVVASSGNQYGGRALQKGSQGEVITLYIFFGKA